MSLTRRQLLIFFGSSAATTALAPTFGQKLFGSDSSVATATELSFTPVRLPHPLPIYQNQRSFLAIANGQGTLLGEATSPAQMNLSSYTPIDDVVVPPEYERYLIVSWGDRVFPNEEEYFGYNCDYTGYVPINGNREGYLWVNHEYASFPISRFAPEAPADITEAFQESGPIVIPGFPTVKGRELSGEFLYNLGGSIVRIAQGRNRRYAVVKDSKNRRLHGLSGLGINRDRSDSYSAVTSWGSKSYQQGDQNYLIGTGPAATEVFAAINSDGLGNRIIGTAYNCSGGTTPWGTILSCEENFQGSSAFFVGVTEAVKPDGTQTGYSTGTTGTEFGLVGEKYGWTVEIAPGNPNYRPRKHTWLGRYRHENVAMRAEAGRKLVAYLGDDRRGGHTWKFVSKGKITNPKDKKNSRLFEDGTLYVAKYNADGTGEWLPLNLNSPTNPIPPSVLSSVEFAALGSAQREGLLPLPRRNGVAGQTVDGGSFALTRLNEAAALPGYQGKKLSDFYTSQGAILVDAFLAANLIGGTPTARPEDLEVHPKTKEVFIAYTDGAPGSDGYPDSRIFVVAKYSDAPADTQQSGGLYKIIENSRDGAGTTFRWQRFAQGGEAGSEDGAGFANVDNLAFDKLANVWGVTDMSTGTHNGFEVGATGKPTSINHTSKGNVSSFTGVFGNNWLFYIPTRGQHAGEVVPFAYGPPRCEMTGPTFVGETLIIAVQHPGEDCPFVPKATLSREIEMLALDGSLFNQTRTVSRGSNWPSNLQGNPEGPPKPAVIGIQRKRSLGRFT
ncbi:PhoX family protein [Phormidesmis sp. 146-33]